MSLETQTSGSHYIVVYQYGKVASTSIVNSLNAVPNVTAVQSHFLGTTNLKEMVDIFVDVERPSHFYKHNLGQFLKNLDITRNVYEFRRKLRPDEKMTVLSLVRNPLDWLRSSIAQDIAGYLPFFRAVARVNGIAYADETELIELTLPDVIVSLCQAIVRADGIDSFLDGGKPWAAAYPKTEDPSLDHDFRLFFALMLRPFSWFKEHFESFIGIELVSMAQIAPHILYKDAGWTELFVLRYEDIHTSMPFLAERLGFGDTFALSQDNVSESKTYSLSISKAFKTEAARTLEHLFKQTKYTVMFGY